MSPEHQPTIDALGTQLRSYGRWLDQRTEVALGPLDLDTGAGAGPGGGGPPRRPRVLTVAAAGVAALALLAVGVGIVADGRSGRTQGVSTATADQPDRGGSDVPTSDGDQDRSVPGPVTDGAARSGSVAAAPEAGAGDPVAPPPEPAAGAGVAPGADDPGAGDPDGHGPAGGEGDSSETDPGRDGEPESYPDAVLTPSTSVLPDHRAESTQPASGDESAAASWGPGGLIASPANGAVINLAVTTTIEAHPVAGATTYTFEAWQEGRLVLSAALSSPRLLLASQLISDGPWSLGPGPTTIRATATDAGGSVVATGEVSVEVRTAGGSPVQPTFPQVTRG